MEPDGILQTYMFGTNVSNYHFKKMVECRRKILISTIIDRLFECVLQLCQLFDSVTLIVLTTEPEPMHPS